MTQDEGDGFEGFVAARWAALESVALVATLDPDRARTVTASTVAALRGRWSDVVEDGAPTVAARTELLTRLQDLGRGDGPQTLPVPERLTDAARDPSAPEDPVPAALLAALAREPAPVRAALAAGPLWELDDDEVDRLVPGRGGLGRAGHGRPRAGDDDVLAAARHRLLEAHRVSLAGAGAAPADHRAPIDLADLLERLAATLPEPPDPADLVRARERGLRRRSLVVGALAVAGVGVGGWAVASRSATPTPAARPPRPAPSTAGPNDPAWATVTRWPPRGDLARDPGVQAMLASDAEGARLLFAGDVGGRRLVVSTDPSIPVESGFVPRVWGGPAGTPASRLTTLQVAYGGWSGDAQDTLGMAFKDGRRSVLLALARPDVTEGMYSLVVRPDVGGRILRDWTRFALRDGVATTVLPRSAGPAARLRLADTDGPMSRELTEQDLGVGPGGSTESTVAELAGALGVPRRSLEVERTSHVLPRDSLRDVLGAGPARAEVVVVRTADGAVVRFASFRAGVGGDSQEFSEYGNAPLVIPAASVRAPYVSPLYGASERPLYFVTAPARATTVQLRTLSGAPLCRVTPVRGGAALPRMTTAFSDEEVRVVAKAANGRVLYDDVPPPGRDVLDLFDYDDMGSGSGTYYG